MTKIPNDDENPPKETLPLIVKLISVFIVLLAMVAVTFYDVLSQDSPLLTELRNNSPVLFLLSYGWCMMIMLLSLKDIKAFLDRHERIDSLKTFAHFKAIARQNMYLALLMILMLVIAITSGGFMLVDHGLAGGLVVSIAGALFGLLTARINKLEQAIRNMPVADHFEKEYQRICYRWLNAALPDF